MYREQLPLFSWQLPLFSWMKVIKILSHPKNSFQRIYWLFLRWEDKYGKLAIQVNEEAIIVWEYHIPLEDITPENSSQFHVKHLDYISFSPYWNLLTTKPQELDLLDPEAWMALVNRIPWAWIEKRNNLLELLGNKCFFYWDDFYTNYYGEKFGIFCSYHTNESLWDDDGSYYWQLIIREHPLPLLNRHCTAFINEYVGSEGYDIDKKLALWGDEFIHFDVFSTDRVPSSWSILPGSLRLNRQDS